MASSTRSIFIGGQKMCACAPRPKANDPVARFAQRLDMCVDCGGKLALAHGREWLYSFAGAAMANSMNGKAT